MEKICTSQVINAFKKLCLLDCQLAQNERVHALYPYYTLEINLNLNVFSKLILEMSAWFLKHEQSPDAENIDRIVIQILEFIQYQGTKLHEMIFSELFRDYYMIGSLHMIHTDILRNITKACKSIIHFDINNVDTSKINNINECLCVFVMIILDIIQNIMKTAENFEIYCDRVCDLFTLAFPKEVYQFSNKLYGTSEAIRHIQKTIIRICLCAMDGTISLNVLNVIISDCVIYHDETVSSALIKNQIEDYKRTEIELTRKKRIIGSKDLKRMFMLKALNVVLKKHYTIPYVYKNIMDFLK